MTRPAIAGPMKRAKLKKTALTAIAPGNRLCGIRAGISAKRAGWLRAAMLPRSVTSTTSSQMSRMPKKDAANSVEAWAIATLWVRKQMRFGSPRSAMTPPIGLRMTAGNRSAKATMPSQVADSVNCQVSQPMAIRCVQLPISETKSPLR